MEAKAILLVSALLVGCQSTDNVQQYAQSLSAAGWGETARFTSQVRWMDDGASIAPDDDLWVFIGDELRMRILENGRIHEQKQKYLRNKSYLHDVTLRTEPHIYWIAGQAKKRNVPMELVLLPIMESVFDPHATSSANATGIWQIVPSAGCNYGLKQTHNYDVRRNVVASTIAVLDMMQRLSRVLDGNWPLTVAVYNSGEGRVVKVTKTSKAREKSTDFWSLPLLQEARQYVPKMLASSDILKNSKRYGVRLPTTNESRALARVYLSSPAEMAKVVDMAGIPVSKLKTFNAGAKGPTLDTSGPQYAMVSKKHADQLRESLASGEIVVIQSTLAADNTPLNSRVYTIRSGDMLSDIASRPGVSTEDLQQWNKLCGFRLKPGQSLTISIGSSAQRLANNSDSITYRARKGDSFSSIAKRCGVNIRDVIRWDSDTANLQPGDKLMLFVKNNNMSDSWQTR